MVEVVLVRDRDGALRGFRAAGHAGFAERGADIVCAAVSALTEVTVLGLQARLGLEPAVEMDEERGLLLCTLDRDGTPPEMWARAQDLLETLALGLGEIAKEYADYIRVREVTA